MNMQMESMTAIHKLARGEMSLKARLGYVALVLTSAAMTAVIVSLWATEPVLPLRTQLAFGAMSVIGISWAALGSWALATRRVLLARDRLIAGWMSVVFSAAFLSGALAAVVVADKPAAFVAAALGLVMFAFALRVLSSARRRFAALAALRAQLETGSDPIC